MASERLTLTDEELVEMEDAANQTDSAYMYVGVTALLNLLAELRELRTAKPAAGPWSDLSEDAWVIIANVNRGNWDGEPRDWIVAASRWRERYHKMLAEIQTEGE